MAELRAAGKERDAASGTVQKVTAESDMDRVESQGLRQQTEAFAGARRHVERTIAWLCREKWPWIVVPARGIRDVMMLVCMRSSLFGRRLK